MARYSRDALQQIILKDSEKKKMKADQMRLARREERRNQPTFFDRLGNAVIGGGAAFIASGGNPLAAAGQMGGNLLATAAAGLKGFSNESKFDPAGQALQGMAVGNAAKTATEGAKAAEFKQIAELGKTYTLTSVKSALKANDTGLLKALPKEEKEKDFDYKDFLSVWTKKRDMADIKISDNDVAKEVLNLFKAVNPETKITIPETLTKVENVEEPKKGSSNWLKMAWEFAFGGGNATAPTTEDTGQFVMSGGVQYPVKMINGKPYAINMKDRTQAPITDESMIQGGQAPTTQGGQAPTSQGGSEIENRINELLGKTLSNRTKEEQKELQELIAQRDNARLSGDVGKLKSFGGSVMKGLQSGLKGTNIPGISY